MQKTYYPDIRQASLSIIDGKLQCLDQSFDSSTSIRFIALDIEVNQLRQAEFTLIFMDAKEIFDSLQLI